MHQLQTKSFKNDHMHYQQKLKKVALVIFLLYINCLSKSLFAQNGISDVIVFGQESSEKQHQLAGVNNKVVTEGMDQSARVMLPQTPATFEGGVVSFQMKVDPAKQNYFSVKLWGSDKDRSLIMLFVDGKQVGYRHIGDIDFVFFGNGEPFFKDRFVYVTIPIPLQSTIGKTSIKTELKSYGEIWPYGYTFDSYQKKMENPTLGFYSAYTHTSTFIESNEKPSVAKTIVTPPIRTSPGIEVIDKVKERVNNELNKIINASNPPNQQEIMFLAPAYEVSWSVAYHNQQVIKKCMDGMDQHYKLYLDNPTIIYSDKNIYNGDWTITGPIAEGIRKLWPELATKTDETFDDGKGNKVTHRQAWAKLMEEGIKYSTTHRRQYTNQSMIIDLFIYECNEALRLLYPEKALPEAKTLHYLHEAVGLTPWMGIETANGPSKSMGDNYWELTNKGLTKELGFVGYYGEVLDWVNDIYLATEKPGVKNSGDPEIKKQLIKMAKARSYFRYPEVDNEGFKAMRAETTIGWRDVNHYPGDITYGDRAIAWDATPLMTASTTLDPQFIGIAQQMIADNQLFNTISEKLKLAGLRVTKSLLNVPGEYELIRKQASQTTRLPMTDGMPDFVFADEEDGVIALKNGSDRLYASLYWRAGNAINKLAKVHYITPAVDRIANIYLESEFENSGMNYIRPNWANIRSTGSREFYKGIETAQAGEVLPVAKIPEGIAYKQGDENPYAGRASFYKMIYGNYLVAMNSSENKSFELKVPEIYQNGTNLVNKKKLNGVMTITVAPGSTIVLYK